MILALKKTLGLDRAILYVLLNRGWTLLAGFVTLYLISATMSKAEQGYYYTFSSILALQIFFELGFSGIIPSYAVAIRELFPASEASWRIPLTLFTAMSGMAFGSWFAGKLYDHFGFYAPAFGISAGFNLLNLVVIGFLVLRLRARQTVWTAAAD